MSESIASGRSWRSHSPITRSAARLWTSGDGTIQELTRSEGITLGRAIPWGAWLAD